MGKKQNRMLLIEEGVCFLLNRTAWKMRRHMFNYLKQNGYDITPEQWIALNRLWIEEGVFQTELANATFRDKANVTRILDGLVKKNLVVRIMDEGDRRKFRIYLTEEGKALEEILSSRMFSEQNRVLKGLEKEDIENLKRIIEAISLNMD